MASSGNVRSEKMTDFQKLWQVYWNGIQLMYRLAPEVAKMGPDSPHSNSNGDMAFHKLVTSRMADVYSGKVHPLVERFLILQDAQEKKHGELYGGRAEHQSPFSREFLERNLRFWKRYSEIDPNLGLAVYFAVQNGLGERIPLLHGALKHYHDDAHETPEGFVDEFFHNSGYILLIPLLTDDLDAVLKAQEEYLEEIKKKA